MIGGNLFTLLMTSQDCDVTSYFHHYVEVVYVFVVYKHSCCKILLWNLRVRGRTCKKQFESFAKLGRSIECTWEKIRITRRLL